MIKIEIPMKLPSLNEYINECRRNRYSAGKMKNNVENDIGYFINQLPRFNKPIRINFTWVEANKKRDLDNICFAKKFILDALVKAGILENDNKSHISGFTDKFEYADKSKVIVELVEIVENSKKKL